MRAAADGTPGVIGVAGDGAIDSTTSFASLASAPNTDVKVLATGLGVGILLDATLVRALLVPALVSRSGGGTGGFPRPVARVLRVAPPGPAIETAGR